MKHILDYRGYMIFKVSNQEYSVKVDTPDGLLSVGQPHKNLVEALVAINRGLQKASINEQKPSRIGKFFIDFFNISA